MSSDPLSNAATRNTRASDKNLLSSIERLASQKLSEVLDEFFSKADEVLFTESEKAEHSNYQATFLATMRDLRENRSEIARRYQNQLGKCFKNILLPQTTGDSDALALKADFELSLVNDDDLELGMARDSIVNKCNQQFEATLAVLDARFCCSVGQSELLKDETLDQKDLANYNPVSAERLRECFVEAIAELDTELPVLIVLYKIYERALLNAGEGFYDSVNAFFLRSGVLKDYIPRCLAKEDVSHFKTKEERLASEPVGNDAGDQPVSLDPSALANLGAVMQSAIGIARGADAMGVSPSSHFFSGDLSSQSFPGLNVPANEIQSINELAQLLTLLPSMGNSGTLQSQGLQSVGSAMGSIAASETPTVGYDVLLHLLNKMQHSEQSIDTITQQPEPGQTPTQLLETIAEKIQEEGESDDNSIGQSERDTIGLVSMLFQFVIEDRIASKVMQRALGRLQLPIIKVALKDPRFFSKSDHPARILLNAITSACVGWVEQEDYHSDPFYSRISEYIDYLVNEFEDDLSIFEEVSGELQDFLASEKNRVERSEARLIDMEKGRDRAELGRKVVQRIIDQAISTTNESFLQAMLSEHWSNYLLRLWLQDGEDSVAFKHAVEVIEIIQWTIHPARNKNDSRDIVARIPDLLRVLRDGFQTLGLEVNRAGEFFRALAAKHKQAMNRPAGEGDQPAPVAVSSSELNLGELLNSATESSTSHDSSHNQSDSHAIQEAKLETQPATEVAPMSVETSLAGTLTNDASAAEDTQVESQQGVDPYTEQAEGLSVGQWVEVIDDEDRLRCRLAAILRASGKRVFVNRRGVKALDMLISELADRLRQETVVLLGDGQLFDKALSSIIGDLRHQKRETLAC